MSKISEYQEALRTKLAERDAELQSVGDFAKELKQPTARVLAHLQAAGFVNDHLVDCVCRKPSA